MEKKIGIFVLGFIILIGLGVFVGAIEVTKEYPGTTVTAEFVSQEYQFSKGWNLVQGILNPDWVQENSSSISAIYAFNPITKEYVRFYPDPEDDKIGKSDYRWDVVSTIGALWVYSEKEFTSDYWKFEDAPLDATQLFAGWNFMAITSEMIGKSLNQIKGNCDIERVYLWDSKGNQFGTILNLLDDENILNDEAGVGHGFVVDVSSDCKLGISVGVAPPILPDSPNIEVGITGYLIEEDIGKYSFESIGSNGISNTEFGISFEHYEAIYSPYAEGNVYVFESNKDASNYYLSTKTFMDIEGQDYEVNIVEGREILLFYTDSNKQFHFWIFEDKIIITQESSYGDNVAEAYFSKYS